MGKREGRHLEKSPVEEGKKHTCYDSIHVTYFYVMQQTEMACMQEHGIAWSSSPSPSSTEGRPQSSTNQMTKVAGREKVCSACAKGKQTAGSKVEKGEESRGRCVQCVWEG